MVALLDVSVLIALFDVDHPKHDDVTWWFEDHSAEGWATCAITENGLLRIVAATKYANPIPLEVACDSLRKARTTASHQFWPCDLSIFDGPRFLTERILGPAQITDIYLLGLAVAHDGVFVTLDRRISINSVLGATARNLTIL